MEWEFKGKMYEIEPYNHEEVDLWDEDGGTPTDPDVWTAAYEFAAEEMIASAEAENDRRMGR